MPQAGASASARTSPASARTSPASARTSTVETLLDTNLSETNKYFSLLYKQKFDCEPNIQAIKDFTSFVEKEMNIVELYFSHRYTDYSMFSKCIIEIFQSVFKRDITVFEYVKYYDRFTTQITASEDEKIKTIIQEYHENYTNKYKRCSICTTRS